MSGEVVNIMTLVDTKQLFADKGSQAGSSNIDNAIDLVHGQPYIFMAASGKYVNGLNANSELTVQLHNLDFIRWRFEAFDRNENLSVIPVRFWTNYTEGGIDPAKFLQPFPPGLQILPTRIYQAPGTDQDEWDQPAIKYPVTDYFFQTQIIQDPPTNATICYQWTFKLVDESGNTQGYYHWDPFIIVQA